MKVDGQIVELLSIKQELGHEGLYFTQLTVRGKVRITRAFVTITDTSHVVLDGKQVYLGEAVINTAPTYTYVFICRDLVPYLCSNASNAQTIHITYK